MGHLLELPGEQDPDAPGPDGPGAKGSTTSSGE
jgi:hypothetical protein